MMRPNIYIAFLLILLNTRTQCGDNILWDHGIIIKETKKEAEDIKFSMSKEKVLPTLEINATESIIQKPILDNKTIQELYDIGRKMYKAGYYNHAAIYLEECYRQSKKDASIAYSLAKVYVDLANYDKGIMILGDVKTPSEDTLMMLAILHQKNNNKKEAKLYIKRLLNTFPNTTYKRVITLQ